MSAVDEAREMIADYERVGETDACHRNRIALLAHIEVVEKERDDAWRQKNEAVKAWGASQAHIEDQDRAIEAVRAIDLECRCGSALCEGYKPQNEVRRLIDAALSLAQPHNGKAGTECKVRLT